MRPHLINEGIGGIAHDHGVQEAVGQVLGPDGLKEVIDLLYHIILDGNLVAHFTQGVNKGLRGGLAGAAGEAGNILSFLRWLRQLWLLGLLGLAEHLAQALGEVLYIDYPTGVYDVRREFHNNRPELEKLDSLMRPLTEGNLASISSISICGYASPDGTYKDNEILASNRARCFKKYMHTTYAPGYDLYKVSSVPEDWDGLVELLQRHPMNHGDEVLSLIARIGIFEGREKQLMDMHGGAVYRELLKSYFPQLRRIRITVGYEARAFNIEEAASLIYTHPRLLSLQEMYRVAAFYRPGTEQYREIYEIAAYHFPDDVLANINAASAVIMAGDPVSARQYLSKVADDPRAWNDFGVLAYLEGDRKKAEEWFRKALGVEPEKARKNLKKMKNEK